MTHDDRTSDHFIREVDEELRREQLKTLWERFGFVIIGVCILIVAITAGYRGYVWWQSKKAAEEGDRYLTALEAIDAGNEAEGRETLAALAKDGGGYGMLARLRNAEIVAKTDETAAIAAYDEVANDGGVAPVMRDLARVRAGLLALDAGDLDGAESRVSSLDEAGNAWRHTAREILGMVAYQRDALEKARDYFVAIDQDVQAPQGVRNRAGLMISVIDGQLAPSPSADGASGDDAPEAEAPVSGDATGEAMGNASAPASAEEGAENTENGSADANSGASDTQSTQ
ncbi:tetratricopeptide repeat protein [Afifella aestuarii]|uniref:tetratricopeptide repeat protein n=1 Tax=Afifella aestuarii TaxID=1909496 RepID=UPI000FE39284|nr:tetratricopeptide repeat protein [Afifella aestuarii]